MTTELLSVREIRVGLGAVRAAEGRPDAVRADRMVVEAYLGHEH